jgi:hypothetical protein
MVVGHKKQNNHNIKTVARKELDVCGRRSRGLSLTGAWGGAWFRARRLGSGGARLQPRRTSSENVHTPPAKRLLWSRHGPRLADLFASPANARPAL